MQPMWTKKPAATAKPATDRPGSSKAYSAVTIVSSGNGCSAAKGLNGDKVLARSAPRLPLPDCSMPLECRCRYEKHSDRRHEDEGRRMEDAFERAAWYAGDERRKGRGRREDD